MIRRWGRKIAAKGRWSGSGGVLPPGASAKAQTHCGELKVTIAGQSYPHLLFQLTQPMALRRGDLPGLAAGIDALWLLDAYGWATITPTAGRSRPFLTALVVSARTIAWYRGSAGVALPTLPAPAPVPEYVKPVPRCASGAPSRYHSYSVPSRLIGKEVQIRLRPADAGLPAPVAAGPGPGPTTVVADGGLRQALEFLRHGQSMSGKENPLSCRRHQTAQGRVPVPARATAAARPDRAAPGGRRAIAQSHGGAGRSRYTMDSAYRAIWTCPASCASWTTSPVIAERYGAPVVGHQYRHGSGRARFGRVPALWYHGGPPRRFPYVGSSSDTCRGAPRAPYRFAMHRLVDSLAYAA